jgi:hypothetical protein
VLLVGSGVPGGVPPFFAVVDTVAGLAAAIGLGYFAFRLIVLAKRRLLWRVRRKLILSYVFIGFVPALLLVAFSLLCGFLLFYNFSSYLVQSRLQRAERAGAASSRRAPRSRSSAPAAATSPRSRAPAGERGARVSRRLDRRRAGRAHVRQTNSRTVASAELRPAGPGRTSTAADRAGLDRLSGLRRRAGLLAPAARDAERETRTCGPRRGVS